MSNPNSPNLTLPNREFRFAPSPYTIPPAL